MSADVYADMKQGEKGAWISIAAYIALSALKLTIGFYYQSKALQADGWNNLTDIVASMAVLIGLRISQKPPDCDHPYGHLRAETIAALIASFIMATVGIQVILSTIGSIFNGESVTPNPITGWVAVVCGAVMFVVYQYNKRLANRIRNQALMAAAQDNRSDALVSLGAAIGIFGSQIGLPWLDPLAALSVGVLICKTAWDIFRETTHTLTDGFDEAHLERLRKTVAGTDGVRAIREVKARLHGSLVLVDVVVQVDPKLSLIEGHQICDDIEQSMKRKHNITHVHVHVEPMDTGAASESASLQGRAAH
ncbi:cation diffusion facilitator family transporter [Paenibacillus apiarius]|uniref:Cation diffusion facilitator family transporter n=1 Tax=Paenibacillus apiarius TaxID=46240 RepID=A0ABT4DYK0_9BACL|nr:cation diffusion facilitator family transporter [Paenibacillus apiarius]MCY9516382.1 cation diffusion facilitator family transporter [Paenibacillus apiarius]MCY9521158.1 cation diffusion facilitator family transporter [Paenibacillus apiarius]MCY9552005.1 cation diffusion facilitator family transporter [Paenibacillus apiarius]MCY9560950.1 cation diffusion facilitator family transporter [Paenibacillus apiarius]MCY9684579.1 cation diffusion facilitator family transporter [Paenibacillus apiariu